MINVLLDTSPLANDNAIRGVGVYTKLLAEHLTKKKNIQLVDQTETNSETSQQPDLIHYPFFDLFFSTLPLRKKFPTVVTIHDVIPLVFPEHYKPGIKGKMKFFKQKEGLRTVAAIITDSQASKKDIEQYLHIKSDKIHVVYLAANPKLIVPSNEKIQAVRKSLKLPSSYILYVGDINYNKNIPQLIKTLKFLPEEIHLICLGKNFTPQPIREWQWIETQMALSDVAKRVIFLPEVPTDDFQTLSAIYHNAIAYVHPSLYEGFGLPLLEAMQCKTPVICTETSSLPEVAGKYAVFSETDARSIATQVSTVLSWSESKRKKWINSAYKWSQSFSWEKTINKTISVYKSIIS